MKPWPLVLLSLMLASCASAPVATRTEHLFQDRLFAAPSQRIDAADVFAVSDEMKHYVRVEIAGQLAAKGRQRGLFDALYSTSQLRLEYDSAMTRNASQAFAARSGNCLSLVIMTAALAKELGLAVRYQRVSSEEAWSRSGGMYFSSGHVNVTLGRKQSDPRILFDERNLLTIDFLPLKETDVQHAWAIREETVVAMYMNNRAAESLAEEKLNDAYWWAREAIRQDPGFMSSYNTLGVIYRRHERLREAEQVFKHVLERDPGNLQVMGNLALVYDDQGREEESDALMKKVERMQPYPPFHFFNLGLAAMQEGDFKAARDYFTREVDRDATYHEFQFWLAAAYLGLGDVKQARSHLTLAMQNSTTRGEHDLYAAKLDRLSSLRSRQ